MKYALATLVLALPFVVAGQASAQEQDRERPRRDGEMRARMIEEFDADGDGQLNDEERRTARETIRERRGDRPGRGGQARGQGRGGQGRGPGNADRPAPPDPNELFDRYDENKDGQLSREEYLKLTEETRGRRGQRWAREGRPGGPRPEEGAESRPARGPEAGRDAPLANQQDGPPASDEQLGPPRGPRGPEGRGREGRGPGGRGPGFGGPDPNRIFDRFDENGDDQLSRDEFLKLTEWTREMRERFMESGQRGGRGPRGEGFGGPGRGGSRGERPLRPQRPEGDFPPAEVEAPPADDSST